jgi:hypothetical protein
MSDKVLIDLPFASEVAEKAYQSLLKAGGKDTRDQFRKAIQVFLKEKFEATRGDVAYESLIENGGVATRDQFSEAIQTFVLEEARSQNGYEKFRCKRAAEQKALDKRPASAK